jgi:hypothetical protein
LFVDPLDSSFHQTAILGGGQVRSGDFSFEAYLFCDPNLSSSAELPGARSLIDRLGVHTAWRYEGSDLEGPVSLLWGFGETPSQSGGWDGGLTHGSMASFTGGISSDETAQEVAEGTPIQLTFAVEAAGEKHGAALTFAMESTTDGYAPLDIQLEPQP